VTDSLATAVADFLAHKRALGGKYQTEEATLRLLVAFSGHNGVHNLRRLTPALLDAFVAPWPRPRARSFNHLVGILDWAVAQQRLGASPLRRTYRRETAHRVPLIFDTTQARRVLEAAAALADNSRAAERGPTYHTVFALCCGLGLRAGEACGLRLGDVDTDRQLLVVRGGKFGKSRLVPHGPRVGELLARYVERRHGPGDSPLFSFDGRRSMTPCTASQVFPSARHRVGPSRSPTGCPRPGCTPSAIRFAVGCLLRWYREGVDPSARLYRLSTFMGHVSPASTAVYLAITPQLLAEANQRFEAFAGPAWSEATP
jgi:integrase